MRASYHIVIIGVFSIIPSLALGALPKAEEEERRGAPPKAKAEEEHQGAPSKEKAKKGEHPFERFPEPLDQLTCNIADLEKSGHLAIRDVEYGRTAIGREEAVIWTLKVVKPITCRHVIMLLRHFRDVRFYATPEDTMQETHWTMLYYSSSIRLGAVNRKVLSIDEQFNVWVPMRTVDIRKVTSRRADTVVLSRPKR